MSAEESYVQGFLKHGPPWHVQVNEPSSPHHGRVMQVATSRGGENWMVKGLNVRFFIGCRDGKPNAAGCKEKIPCAVDVHPLSCPPSQEK